MNLFEGHKPINAPTGIHSWGVDPYSKDVLLDPTTFYS